MNKHEFEEKWQGKIKTNKDWQEKKIRDLERH